MSSPNRSPLPEMKKKPFFITRYNGKRCKKMFLSGAIMSKNCRDHEEASYERIFHSSFSDKALLEKKALK